MLSLQSTRIRLSASFLAALTGLVVAAAAQAVGTAALVNVKPEAAQSICAAAGELGLHPQEIRLDRPLPNDLRLIVFESRSNLTAAQAQILGLAVQHGAALLVGLDSQAGKDAFNLSFMLPTMAWSWHQTDSGPLAAQEFDPELFSDDLHGLSLPYAHQIHPFSAVERGQSRYSSFEHVLLFSGEQVFLPPGSNEWTRPLIDRDWRIRMRAGGTLGQPLLITGRYGLGHVAVFASGFETLDLSPQGRTVAIDVLKWLRTDERASPTTIAIPQPVVTVAREKRALQVEVSNPTSKPLSATVIGRVLTWEPAIIGDVQKPVEVPAGAKATVELPLPEVTDTSYAASSERDVYQVRLGLLASDGSSLLAPEQTVLADLRPPLLIALHTDDTRTYDWPYAPAPVLNPGNRMGNRIDEYAYKPGQTIHAQIVFDNGTRNIARLAKAADETTPRNPTISALNDGFSMSERGWDSSLHAYGAWRGKKGIDNTLTLTFPRPMLMNSIALVGAADNYRRQDRKNPAAVIVEIDGAEAAREISLPERFLAENGRVRLEFSPRLATTVRLQLPWQQRNDRDEPTIGDVEIWGTAEQSFPPAITGKVSLSLRDVSADSVTPLGDRDVEIASGAHQVVSFDAQLPNIDGKPRFYRLVANLGHQTAQAPVMTIDSKVVLPSMDSLKGKAVEEGFIVTRGFRNIFPDGTGTQELPVGWAGPDDLIWGYSHGMKEDGERSPYSAGRLYVSENDFRHYSSPWRHFYDGQAFYDIAAPLLVAHFQKKPGWDQADTAVLAHSDRWDSGPAVGAQFCWQELIAFDLWLREKKLGQLTGRTKGELTREILEKYQGPWFAYHLEQYQHSISILKDTFAAVGKRLLITSQGCPLVPPAFSAVIGEVVRGDSDDCTWGMAHDDAITTTGKQMGALAFNPNLAMSTLLQWQYNNATLNNAQWHVPAGTTEPSRRFLFDRAFRGTLRLDGSYTSMHSYGYNSNAGDPFALTEADYADWKRVFDLHTLLQPDAPTGAGLVIANSYLNDPKFTRFAGESPIGSVESHAISTAVGVLQRAGLSIPFSSNVLCLEHWQGSSPLIVLNLEKFNDAELAILRSTLARGVHVVAFCRSTESLPPAAAELFGVDPQGNPADGKVIARVADRSVVTKGSAFFVPLDAETMTQSEVDGIGTLLCDHLNQPMRFDAGSVGYGFISNGRKFIVVEDWREEARTLHLRVHATGAAEPTAIGVNDGNRLAVHRDGGDWVVDVPTRPGDGNVICLVEH